MFTLHFIAFDERVLTEGPHHEDVGFFKMTFGRFTSAYQRPVIIVASRRFTTAALSALFFATHRRPATMLVCTTTAAKIATDIAEFECSVEYYATMR